MNYFFTSLLVILLIEGIFFFSFQKLFSQLILEFKILLKSILNGDKEKKIFFFFKKIFLKLSKFFLFFLIFLIILYLLILFVEGYYDFLLNIKFILIICIFGFFYKKFRIFK